MFRMLLTPALALLISAPAHAALPADCTQSQYPVRVIPACSEILRQDPNNAVAYFRRGMAHANTRGSADAAIADFTKAIELNPAFARAYNGRGFAYYQQRDYERALADYNKTVELDPTYALGYLNRAVVHGLKNNTDGAVADLIQTIRLGARGHDGSFIFELLDPIGRNEALKLLAKVIERDSKDAAGYYWRGVIYETMEEGDRALADFNKAIELDPTHVDAYVSRGRAYSSARYDDARAMADYDKAIELDPKNARAYLARGGFHLDQIPDRADRAMAEFSKAIEFDPLYAHAYVQRGFLHALNNEHALAKADFAKALEIEWRLWAMIMGLFPNYLDEIEAERQAKAR